MILITGNDPFVDALCSTLDSLGRAHQRVDTLDGGRAWELRATTLILVEPLPRLGSSVSASERGLREMISAANAPGVGRAIIVTPRPDADVELRAVRRSGIPYTIFRPLPIVEPSLDTNKPVLVARDLADAPAAGVTIEMIVDAVIGVIDGGACGQTIEVAPPPETTWSALLARAGVKPKPVAGWHARIGRWLGARTFDASVSERSAAPT